MKYRTKEPALAKQQVSTALLLAAGTGSRLAPLTDITPKCLVEVNEISILERLIHSLQVHNFKRLVVVVGHQADCIRDFLGNRAGGMEITYITSPLYKTTNNIYSLWLARKAIDEPFLLLESDIVFNPEMLKGMLYPDRMAVAKFLPYMDGTTVKINGLGEVESFCCGAQKQGANHHKTVNIYSFSSISWDLIREKLDQHISNNMVNGYYETVFAEMVNEGSLSLAPIIFDANHWYEIDTIADLRAAELLHHLHYHPPGYATGHVVSKQKGQIYPLQDLQRINTRDLNKRRISRRHSGVTLSAPIASSTTLPQ